MTIIIPNWVGTVLVWMALVVAFLFLLLGFVGKLVACLKQRRVFWCAKVWMTTRDQRSKAKKWTLGQFEQLVVNLQKEDPEFYAQIKHVFTRYDNL